MSPVSPAGPDLPGIQASTCGARTLLSFDNSIVTHLGTPMKVSP